MTQRPRIVHIIDRFQTGGMENGMVNLINGTCEIFEHQIVCLRSFDPAFCTRLEDRRIAIEAINKRSGKDFRAYGRLHAVLRGLGPDLVHTRNLPTIDLPAIAKLATGSPVVHGEHGRDLLEPTGNNLKYNLLRRASSPFVQRYIAVSKDLAQWLERQVRIPKRKLTQIYNGVDCQRFKPRRGPRQQALGPFAPGDFLLGTVGRLEAIKDQRSLLEAFIQLKSDGGSERGRLKLVLIGDGSQRDSLIARAQSAGVSEQVWFAGDRSDVDQLMAGLDLFVLPSRNEGISNTILEAMACGLPVVATAVGGNPELVDQNATGRLIPAEAPDVLAQTLKALWTDLPLLASLGDAARTRAEALFSLEAMISRYTDCYRELLKAA